MSNEFLLQMTLQCAVPFWIERLRDKEWSHVVERARECAQVIAEKGDIILYRSKRRGETAMAFNHLAEGIACLAFSPGGVRTFGLHFEARHSSGECSDVWFERLYEQIVHE